MAIVGLIPFKGPGMCKSRLAPILSPAGRFSLALYMLDGVMKAMKETDAFSALMLLGGDPNSCTMAKKYGFQVLPDQGVGLNENLRIAVQSIDLKEACKVAIFPGDLPFITATSILDILDSLVKYDAVIVPSYDKQGTNTLVIPSNASSCLSFGNNSFQKHIVKMVDLQVKVKVRFSRPLSFDVDTPQDYYNWQQTLNSRNRKTLKTANLAP